MGLLFRRPSRRPNRHTGPCLLAAGLVFLLGACGAESAGAGGNGRGILVIAVDALRRDHLELYGGSRETMPFLSRLAEQSIVFDDAWTTSAGVEGPHVSLLTGCDPLVAISPRVPLDDGSTVAPALPWRVPQELPHLPLELLANGWATGGFVDHPSLSKQSGFGLGFLDFVASGGNSEVREYGSHKVSERLLDWVDDLESGRNWFGYAHFNDLERQWHGAVDDLPMGFDPRPELDFIVPQGRVEPTFHALPSSRVGEFQRSLGEYESIYDTSILQLDRELEALWDELRERGLLERTTVVIVGTYGFSFGEAGLLVDAGSLSEVELRVPMLVRPAAELELPTGRRVEALVSLVDVAPTLLELAGLRIPEGMHGRSWNGVLRGSEERLRDYAFAIGAIHKGFAVADSEHLYIRSLPGQGNIQLAESWFGRRRVDESVVRGLFTRGERLLPGGRLEGVPDQALGDRLEEIGGAWYEDMGSLRDALHLYRWLPSVRDPALLAELRAKGLLGGL